MVSLAHLMSNKIAFRKLISMEKCLNTVHKHPAPKHKDTLCQSNGRFFCCRHVALQSSLRGEMTASPKMSVNKIKGARQPFGSGASSL